MQIVSVAAEPCSQPLQAGLGLVDADLVGVRV
jgi:hypothetical protein